MRVIHHRKKIQCSKKDTIVHNHVNLTKSRKRIKIISYIARNQCRRLWEMVKVAMHKHSKPKMKTK